MDYKSFQNRLQKRILLCWVAKPWLRHFEFVFSVGFNDFSDLFSFVDLKEMKTLNPCKHAMHVISIRKSNEFRSFAIAFPFWHWIVWNTHENRFQTNASQYHQHINDKRCNQILRFQTQNCVLSRAQSLYVYRLFNRL